MAVGFCVIVAFDIADDPKFVKRTFDLAGESSCFIVIIHDLVLPVEWLW